ncbi:MAG TPA: type 1 glutamine amidotransferase domain-containing protein [Geobacteraceae bacterium]
MKALIISADNFEDSELLVPYYRLKEEGIEVDMATPAGGTIRGKHGYEVKADRIIADIDPDSYDLLVLPGGKAPETVRRDAAALAVCRRFFERNKPVAAICHGPQTLISAGLLRGRRATCYRTVADELKEAGALYEDTEVVVDGNLVTSRQPSDLPAFVREMMRLLRHS